MVINILGARGLFRVRREFSVLAERHIFGRPPAEAKSGGAETGNRARKVPCTQGG